MKKIKIILVDDHQIVRDGIHVLLMNVKDVEVIGQASSGEELFMTLAVHRPDLILLDIAMPKLTGIEITKILSRDFSDIKVIILSADTNEDVIFDSISAGARGYLPKSTSRKELIEAIRTVMEGEEYLSESISHTILRNYLRKARLGDKYASKKEEILSEREIEIVKLFAGGLSYKEIADKLFISPRTVESHKNNIMQKLELRTTVDLVKYAIKNKIIDL